MGIGFILVVAKNKIDEALSLLSEMGVAAKMIGEVEERSGNTAVNLVH
jgi:phosphoribosylaminoimidazole (AIR) synthetase